MTLGSVVVIGSGLWFLFTLFGYGVVLLMIIIFISLMWFAERRTKDQADHSDDTQ